MQAERQAADQAAKRRQLDEALERQTLLRIHRAERQALQTELEQANADRQRLEAANQNLLMHQQQAEASWQTERAALEERHHSLVARYLAELQVARQSGDEQLRTILDAHRARAGEFEAERAAAHTKLAKTFAEQQRLDAPTAEIQAGQPYRSSSRLDLLKRQA